MVAPTPEHLAEMIRTDVREGSVASLERTVRASHPADLAAALHELTLPQALAVFSSHDTGYETISSKNCPVFPPTTTMSLWSAGGST